MMYILGVITGLVIGLINIVLYSKSAKIAENIIKNTVENIKPKNMATVVDISDPIKELYKDL